MSTHNTMPKLIAIALLAMGSTAFAADSGTITADEMMTPQERVEQRNRMRAATTDEERATIRAENHQRMTERAEKQGKTLVPMSPQDRPMAGNGGRRNAGQPGTMGAGQGGGRGMMGNGQGGGRGPGAGRNSQ